MITRGRQRNRPPADHRGDLLGPVEHPSLLRYERQAPRLEPSPEGPERRDGLAEAGGEDPEVVNPAKVPHAGRPEDLVRPGQHGVRQDGGWVRPDGKPGNTRIIERFEQGGHAQHVAHRASHLAEGPPYEVGADRRIAPVDVRGDERAGGEGQAVPRPHEAFPRRNPWSESQGDRRHAGNGAVGHDLLAQLGLDRRHD